MAILSSRPDEGSDELALVTLSFEELQLVGAFLWVTRLGKSVSPYSDAAFTLMDKIEELMGNDFLEHAGIDVDMKVDILDQQGNIERSVGAHWIEIDV
jgi:hypothetical protein